MDIMAQVQAQVQAWAKQTFWRKRDHVSASRGTADAGLPVVLASDGKLAASIIGAILTGLGTIVTAGFNLTLGGHSVLNAIITGGGTITTAGYNLTLGGHVIINGGGFTLTIPATGTAALVSSGTWTPGVSFGGAAVGITYGTQVGRWVRIDNIIHAHCYVALSNKGSSTGNAAITGLPVAAKNVTNYYQTGQVRMTNLSSIAGHVQGYVAPTGTTYNLEYLSTGTVAAMTNSNFANNTDIILSLSYEV